MNAGLSNLATLKANVLPSTIQADTTFDDVLSALGLGVAGLLEKHCNRKFVRTVGDTITFSADRDHFFLPRYPVESVASVEVKTDQTSGFVSQTGAILNRDDACGHLYFGAYLGDFNGVVRVTWTGGYWFDTTEDDSGSLPAGATAIPADLQQAWLLQCQTIWLARDKLGLGLVAKDSVQFVSTSLFGVELSPLVKQMLAGFIRYQMS